MGTAATWGGDGFAVLGLPRAVSWGEARRAYRRQAREAHPDGGGTAERFREVRTAWEDVRERVAPPAAPPRTEREALLRRAYRLEQAAVRVLDVRV